ncbi:MAG: class II aldolase/adducin family protein [Actinomycetota bacterium]|nr:class II aldolase/adducin family protein [Actinomycetota bacterium]
MQGGIATELRAELVSCAARLRESGVLSKSLHGNLSAMTENERESFWMTGSSLKTLSEGDLGRVTFDGEVLEGGMRSTEREVVAMHAVIYQKRPEVRCVIHTHSPSATTFAVARRPLDCVAESLARWGFSRETPVAAYGPRGSKASVEAISSVLDEHGDVPAILLASHGVLVFGHSVEEALRRSIALEEAAELALRATALGGAATLTEAEAFAAMGRRAEFEGAHQH